MKKRIILIGQETLFPLQSRNAIAQHGYDVRFFDCRIIIPETFNWSDCDLLIIEHSDKCEPFSICDKALTVNRYLHTILVTVQTTIDILEERLNRLYPNNILTSVSFLERDMLLQTIDKVFADDIFGFRFYIAPEAVITTLSVSDSHQKEAYIQNVVAFANKNSIRPRIIEAITDVLDEMIMNVIYDAPTDADGRHCYAACSRTERILLTPSQSATLGYVLDNDVFGLSISDPFGSITRERVLYYLHKCYGKGDKQIDAKSGGAGLGIFKIFESVNQFVLNVHPGHRTEFLVFISTGNEEFRRKSQSFNFFIKG